MKHPYIYSMILAAIGMSALAGLMISTAAAIVVLLFWGFVGAVISAFNACK